MSKRVLVLWADDNSSNLGVRALSQGVFALAQRAWGDDTTVDFQSFDVGPLGTQLSGKIVAKGLMTRSRDLRLAMSKYDVVLDTGAGDSFTDIYGLKRLAIMAYTRHVAKLAGVPVIMAPQTIGPFKTRIGRLTGRHTLRNAQTVFVRDSISQGFARELGREPDRLATDVVFALPQPTLRAERADVGLNVSGLLWNTDSHVSGAEYRSMTRELIRNLLDSGRSVTLIPHVIENPSTDNDMDAVRDLKTEFGDAVQVYVPSDLPEVRAFVAGCNVVIGARMHACLNALSVGTPAIPLAYSRKFAPLLGDLGWNHTLDLKKDTEIVAKTLEILARPDLREEAAKVRELAERRLSAVVDRLGDFARV
ncbi:polysaccharide pyruvyl transferase family protein [Arthrobacter sp. M4]|uniref:polysaccharide pyruvyl transferase family protein n=1 Tax=Arthrobacter sp. M4 TaxID=218160 RepID=UPI001CDCC32A|nr:polysaccharide pyruvyl transferase family protein [Arthrobacter sp. M4]MCA4133064.1 polysaccharide pyruvyl transferase family protein [Arthrobacter sp. M4]